MPFPLDPNAPRIAHPDDIEAVMTELPEPTHHLDPDAPDPNDVRYIRDLNDSIAEAIQHFTDVEWPAAHDVARTVLIDWLNA